MKFENTVTGELYVVTDHITSFDGKSETYDLVPESDPDNKLKWYTLLWPRGDLLHAAPKVVGDWRRLSVAEEYQSTPASNEPIIWPLPLPGSDTDFLQHNELMTRALNELAEMGLNHYAELEQRIHALEGPPLDGPPLDGLVLDPRMARLAEICAQALEMSVEAFVEKAISDASKTIDWDTLIRQEYESMLAKLNTLPDAQQPPTE